MDNVEIIKKRDNKEGEIELNLCTHCGNEIPKSEVKSKTRKFCSVECNRRFFSLQRYYKIKDTVEYKSYRKEYYKKWLDKNRDKFNASMRKASLKYQRKKKEERQSKNQEKEVEKNENM